MTMVFPLTVASDCCAGSALAVRVDGGKAWHGHEPAGFTQYVGVLHVGSRWAFRHAHAPARIGQQTPD